MRWAKIACAADDSLIKHPEVGKCFQTALPECLSGPYLGWGRPLAILEGGTHWLGGGPTCIPKYTWLTGGKRWTVDCRLQAAGWG